MKQIFKNGTVCGFKIKDGEPTGVYVLHTDTCPDDARVWERISNLDGVVKIHYGDIVFWQTPLGVAVKKVSQDSFLFQPALPEAGWLEQVKNILNKR